MPFLHLGARRISAAPWYLPPDTRGIVSATPRYHIPICIGLTPLTVMGSSTDLYHTSGCNIPVALCIRGYRSFDLSSPLLTDRLAGLSPPSILGASLLPFGIIPSAFWLTPLIVTGASMDLYHTFGLGIPVAFRPFFRLISQLSSDESVNSSS